MKAYNVSPLKQKRSERVKNEAIMNNTTNKSKNIIQHHCTEELLNKKSLKTAAQLHEAETMRLYHELKVHQIELKLQNEELIKARSAAQDSSEKYAKLYDFAPSGYFTLSKEGKIMEINLCASQMLGKERLRLKNRLVGLFLSNDTKPIFNLFLEKVFNSNAKESCKVVLSTDYNFPMYVFLTGIADENREQCLVTVVDITELRQAE